MAEEKQNASPQNQPVERGVNSPASGQETEPRLEGVHKLAQKLREMAYVRSQDVITDSEAAQAAVMLLDEKGAAALESLVDRVLDGKPLLGYEKSYLRQCMKTKGDKVKDLNRRQFLAAAGMSAAGTTLLGVLAKNVTDTVDYWVSKADADSGSAKDLREKLAGYADSNNLNANEKELYLEIDKKLAAVESAENEPRGSNSMLRLLTYAAIYVPTAISFGLGAKEYRDTRKELDDLYTAAAQYLAHKLSDMLKEDKAQALQRA